jgi:hypothetical protein
MIIDPEYCEFDPVSQRLTVTLGLAPEGGFQVRLRSWNEGGGVELKEGGRWTRNDDAFDFPIVSEDVCDLEPAHPVRAYHDALPADVTSVLRQFSSLQCRLLHVIGQLPESAEMAGSAPILFWLASNMLGPTPSRDDVRRLYTRRRVMILDSFCGNASRSHLKFLSKICEFGYSLKDLELLRRIFQDEDFLKKVRHYRQINWPVLKVFYTQRYVMDLGCAKDCLAADSCRDAFRYLYKVCRDIRDIRMMCKMLECENPEQQVFAMKSAFQIRDLHDKIARDLSKKEKEAIIAHYGEIFPPSPLKETKDIEYISNVGDLLEEGLVMRHCAGEFVYQALRGDVFIYRVHAPERATMAVQRSDDGELRIDQVKLYRNGKSSRETLCYLQKWIDSQK